MTDQTTCSESRKSFMNYFRDGAVRILTRTMGEGVTGNEKLRGQRVIGVIHWDTNKIHGKNSSCG